MNSTKIVRFSVLIILILSFFIVQSIKEKIISVEDLRCEYRIDPLGIDNLSPRFSWKIENDKKSRGLKQVAYQILVASTPELLSRNEGDLWNSEKVMSDQSVNNRYEGVRLTSRQQCFWKVRVWTQMDAVTEWSETAKFTVGLLSGEDWSGEWIEHIDQNKINHNWYRKNFDLAQAPTSAYVSVASFGYHELYVNGEKITDDIMNPAQSHVKSRIPYITYDIKDQLKVGDNVIAVWHGAGWARWERYSEYKHPPFVFKADVDIRSKDNTMLFGTDETWRAKHSNSSYYGDWDVLDFGGEIVDERATIPDWNRAEYDDSSWDNAIIYSPNTRSNQVKYLPTGNPNRVKTDATDDTRTEITAVLSAQMVEPQVKYKEVTPIGVSENGDGSYTVDMGENYTGTFEMKMHNGVEGQEVTFDISDKIEVKCAFFQTSKYIYNGSGEGMFQNRFNYAGGRWITITGIDYMPQLEDIKGYVITSDRKRTSQFSCSNELLNQIYEVNINTYLANTVDGIMVDCPHRERRGWGEVTVAAMYGDAFPNFETGAYMDQYSQFMRDAQYENGSIRGVINERDRDFLMWKANNPITILETYKTFGDKQLLRDNYESTQRWMEWLYQHSDYDTGGALKCGKHGSREFPGLGDWCTPKGNSWSSSNSPESIHFNNCLYAYMLDCALIMANELGEREDAAIYADRLRVQREATHKLTYDPKTGKYGNGIQVSQAFALVSGVTPESERKKVEAALIEESLYGFPYFDVGSSGQALYTRYFIESGERMDIVYSMLEDKGHPGYGYFIEQGVTTWPERWAAVGSSRIHTCYTGIGGYFIYGFGGIRPDKEDWGMQNFLIKPALVGDLTYANTEFESLYGTIKVDWSRDGSKAKFNIEIPANSSAKLYLPAKDKDVIFESGISAEGAKGVSYIGVEKSAAMGQYVIYRVESGVYEFEVTKMPKVSLPEPLVKRENIAQIGRWSASSFRVKAEKEPFYEAFKVNDGNGESMWMAKDKGPQWIEVEWIRPQMFNCVNINEVGDNIQSYALEYWSGESWEEIISGESSSEMIHFDSVIAKKCRLNIKETKGQVAISEFEIYNR